MATGDKKIYLMQPLGLRRAVCKMEKKLILTEVLKKLIELDFFFKMLCLSFLCEKQSAC